MSVMYITNSEFCVPFEIGKVMGKVCPLKNWSARPSSDRTVLLKPETT